MKSEKDYNKYLFLENLQELHRLSNFVSYKRLGKNKSKMIKKLKKVIKKVESGNLENIIDNYNEKDDLYE